MSDILLQTMGLNKVYGTTIAAQDVAISIQSGRVHALVGENGAGKSTVIKMITGLVRPNSGHLRWQGRVINIHSPREAQSLGIVAVQQELTLVDTMTVAQNIWLGHEPFRAIGTIDRRSLKAKSTDLILSMGLSFDPEATVGKLSLSEKQLVEILKALSFDPKLLVLDEATSTLDDKEVEMLQGIVEKLRTKNCGIVFVSHRMREIFQFCEYCTVMKDGRVVFEHETSGIDEQVLITKMTGREMNNAFPPKNHAVQSAEVLLDVKGLRTRAGLRDIDLQLRSGEILGIGGLQGHGQVELLESLFGLRTIISGRVELDGRAIALRKPGDAIEAGMALVPEDRKSEGLFIDRTLEENLVACSFKQCSRLGVLSESRIKSIVDSLVQKMTVKAPSPKEIVRRLSGGNQQKVAVGRWLARQFKVFLLIEPTRGIDVGTKSEIYELLRRISAEGVGIIIATNEMIELVGLCDTVLVLFEQRVSTILRADDITEHNILTASFGHGGELR